MQQQSTIGKKFRDVQTREVAKCIEASKRNIRSWEPMHRGELFERMRDFMRRAETDYTFGPMRRTSETHKAFAERDKHERQLAKERLMFIHKCFGSRDVIIEEERVEPDANKEESHHE